MSANLPPQFYTVSAKLKEVKTSEEKISILEELLAIVPKHKGTEKVQRDIKTKIAKLRKQKPKRVKREDLYSIRKEGAGQIVIVGPANSGKSSLLNALTNANAKVAPYSFTTEIPQPAMMPYENILIQLVDTPPLTKASPPWLKGILKAADGLLAIFDLSSENLVKDIENLQKLLNNWGITDKKILFLGNKIDLEESKKNLKKIEPQCKINPAPFGGVLNPRQKDCILPSVTPPQSGGVFKRCGIKIISCLEGTGVDELKKEIFDLLEIVRVYTKSSNKSSPDFEHPFIFKKNSRLIELTSQIHQDFFFSFKYAKLFKKNSKKPQFVGKDYLLQDEDIIEIHI